MEPGKFLKKHNTAFPIKKIKIIASVELKKTCELYQAFAIMLGHIKRIWFYGGFRTNKKKVSWEGTRADIERDKKRKEKIEEVHREKIKWRNERGNKIDFAHIPHLIFLL